MPVLNRELSYRIDAAKSWAIVPEQQELILMLLREARRDASYGSFDELPQDVRDLVLQWEAQREGHGRGEPNVPITGVMGGEASEQVQSALCAMSFDWSARERLALASTMSHGEETWRLELIRALRYAGVQEAEKEQTLSGVRLIDLVVSGEAFEVKSSLAGFAIRDSAEKTRAWFEKDALKLRRLAVPGHQLITIATMVTARNRRWKNVNPRPSDSADQWMVDRRRALDAYLAYAEVFREGPVQHIDLGQGEVPGDKTLVQLDALLFCVHRPPT